MRFTNSNKVDSWHQPLNPETRSSWGLPPEWKIGDSSLQRTRGSGNWTTRSDSMMIAVHPRKLPLPKEDPTKPPKVPFSNPNEAVRDVPADWELIQNNVAPGEKFRLLFVTSTTHNGSSSRISTYNTFVQNRAAAGPEAIRAYSAEFRAVASTPSVDARDNTGTRYDNNKRGVPIYWMGGQKVADDYKDFYDGVWSGGARGAYSDGTIETFASTMRVFTGSKNDGTEDSNAVGDTHVAVGNPHLSPT